MKNQQHTTLVFGALLAFMLCTTSCQSNKGGNGCGYWGNQEIQTTSKQESQCASKPKIYNKIEKNS